MEMLFEQQFCLFDSFVPSIFPPPQKKKKQILLAGAQGEAPQSPHLQLAGKIGVGPPRAAGLHEGGGHSFQLQASGRTYADEARREEGFEKPQGLEDAEGVSSDCTCSLGGDEQRGDPEVVQELNSWAPLLMACSFGALPSCRAFIGFRGLGEQ